MCRTWSKGQLTSGGEQPLPPNGSCNLGSINLGNFVQDPYTDHAEVDWGRLAGVTRRATHFLDNVIDANKYPVESLGVKARSDRRIGLGVMGWAEMLVQLGLPYDSAEGVEMARRVMFHIKVHSLGESIKLGTERGVYPEWKGSLWEQAGVGVRNATLTTVAPTGTISLFASQSWNRHHQIVADNTDYSNGMPTAYVQPSTYGMPCSGGIEPKFALAFTRNQAEMVMLDVDQQFEFIARNEGWYSESIMKKVAKKGTARGVKGVPERWQRVFATSHDIAPEWHVRMQSAFQGGDDTDVVSQPIDAACSKTINFAHDASLHDVNQAYRMAWDLGLKGITIYRDGARAFQVLSAGESKDEPPAVDIEPTPGTGMVADLGAVLAPMEHPEDSCPSGGTIKHESGCVSCTCGWSACHIS